MQRAMVGFHRDELGDWVAELSCGHTQHVRHRPPWMLRPWVLSEAGRAGRLGQSLDCPACDARRMPEGHAPYHRTPTFTEQSTPRALRERHDTKAGVWAVIHVTRGTLDYFEGADPTPARRLHAGEALVVPAQVEHRAAPGQDGEFYVEFWRRAANAAPAPSRPPPP